MLGKSIFDRLFTAILLTLLLIPWGCRSFLTGEEPADNPLENFRHLWQTVDQRYSFFELKGIDWDSLYTVYEGGIRPDMSRFELFDQLAALLFELEDGHVNLISTFDQSRNWEWYLDHPDNFNRSLLERHYWGEYEISGPLVSTTIDSIGYLYYDSFSRLLRPANIDHVLTKFHFLKGVIIDLRDNGGGSLSNARLLASRFADSSRHVLNYWFKSGPGHQEFYPEPEKQYVEPAGPLRYTGPVVLLTNRRCYSATSFFVQMMKAFPYVRVIGDDTGGGGGFPIYNELPNGWRFRFSSNQATAPNGTQIEPGVPVDIRADLDPEAAAGGTDTILERALQLLR